MYIDFDSRVKFAILIGSVLVLILGAGYFSRSKLLTAVTSVCVGLVFLVALATVSVAQTSRMTDSPSSRNFVAQAIGSLFESYWEVQHGEKYYARDDLAELFAKMTNTKPSGDDSPFFGRAKDNDVIVFVLETGSDQFVDLRDDLDSFPALARLSQHSLLALNHYVTFPASAESLFSLFNSVYPPRSYYTTCIVTNPLEHGNVNQTTKKRAYSGNTIKDFKFIRYQIDPTHHKQWI